MANIMSQFKLRNKPSRNAFDLSTRNAFSAKLGELLPVLCDEVLPGDKFKINLSHFSRTKPLTSPAYVRIKEYYDFIYVPTRLLWKYYDNFVTQMPNTVAASGEATEVNTISRTPYFTTKAIAQRLLRYLEGQIHDELGFDKSNTSMKLLSYLNYGWLDDPLTVKNIAVSPFPLLAYQKAYNDIYRWDAWEAPTPHSYNLDYMTTGGEIGLTNEDGLPDNTAIDFFNLRYANYPKDLIMGVLPNSQFGDVAVVNTSNLRAIYRSPATTGVNAQKIFGTLNGTSDIPLGDGSDISIDYSSNINSAFNFSILALRQAEFLQKWKEVALTAKQDYKNQIEAHWGVKVSAARGQSCEYLGGISANVQISGETNTNLASDGTTIIRGTAMSGARGQIDYTVPEHGYILAIYHASPLLDYNSDTMIHPNLMKTSPTDFAIPEMDKTGMQNVPYNILDNTTSYGEPSDWLGYAPRYIDYKTDIDRCHGEFCTFEGYDNWVAPFDMQDVADNPDAFGTYLFFKVRPSIFDGVFGVNVSSNINTDQLLCNASFDIKAVRNLDVNGMPY